VTADGVADLAHALVSRPLSIAVVGTTDETDFSALAGTPATAA
jgi:hypothetical protein